MSGPVPTRRYVVLYDGDCRVCRAFVAKLAKWDSGEILEITPSQAPGIRQRFPWISPQAYGESVQVVRLADGRTWQGAAALEELLDVLPRGRRAGWIFRIPFARGITERFYRSFAKNRYRLGCGDHCRTS
jgi:predicted DCC family thiol-disulfide oxidoreductase YuxK